MCPERFNTEELQEIKKAVGSKVWASLYQQRPSPAEGGIIKRHWLKYCDRLPEGCTDYLQSWDLSFGSTKESGSWVVGQVWARKGATPVGRLLAQFLGGLAEFEKSLVRERTMMGLQYARSIGKTFGRPKRRDDHAIKKLRADGFSYAEIQKQLCVSKGSVCRALTPKTCSKVVAISSMKSGVENE